MKHDADSILFVASCVLVSCLGSFNFGYTTGIMYVLLHFPRNFTTPASTPSTCSAGNLPSIEATWGMSAIEKGCVVACVLAGAAVGAAISRPAANLLGRSRSQAAATVAYAAGAAVMATAPSLSVLIVGRTLAGVGVGLSSCLVNIYISEVVPAERRGAFGAMAPLAVTAGILSSYAINLSSLSWRMQLAGTAVPAVLQLLAWPWLLPETQEYISWRREKGLTPYAPWGGTYTVQPISVNNTEQAAHAPLLSAEPALTTAAESTASLQLQLQAQPPSPKHNKSVCGGLLYGPSRAALVVAVALQLLQQASGINIVVYYGPQVLSDAGFSHQDAVLGTFVVGVAQLLATAVLARLVDGVGRRPLALSGLAGMVLGLSALATSAAPGVNHDSSARWIAVGSLLLFRVAFSLSLGPLPYIVTAEVFPTATRASGVAVAWVCNWVANFAISLSFPPLLKAVSPTGVYASYAAVSVLAAVYVAYGVPETSSGIQSSGDNADDKQRP